MSDVFKSFMNREATQSIQMVRVQFDQVQLESLLDAYEDALYGDFTGETTLLHCPSQRYRWLIARSVASYTTWLSTVHSLSQMLSGLEDIQYGFQLLYQRQRQTQRFWGWLWQVDVQTPLRAQQHVWQLYYDLVKESAVIVAVLAHHLKEGYELASRVRTMSSSDIERAERLFFELCHTMVELNQHVIRMRDACRLQQAVTDQNDKTAASFTLDRHTYFDETTALMEQSLQVVQLSWEDLRRCHQQRHSFWKGRRYRAKLAFLKYYYQRHAKALVNDMLSSPSDQWRWSEYASQQVVHHQTALHRWFHRRAYQQYREFQQQLTREQQVLARMSLIRIIQRGDLDDFNATLSLTWIRRVAPQAEMAWQMLVGGLQSPELANGLEWERAFNTVCGALEMECHHTPTWLKRLVKELIAPQVGCVYHAAYPMVYRYDPAAAYRIAQPTLNDILIHLQDDDAWLDPGHARSHLLFLMGATQKNTPRLSATLDRLVETLAFTSLFHQDVSVRCWQRLEQVVTCYGGSDVTQQCVHDFCEWLQVCKDGDTLLDSLEQTVHEDVFLAGSLTDWMAQVSRWARLIDLIRPALNDAQHVFHAMSMALLQRFAERLKTLLMSPRVLKTEGLRQLTAFLSRQVVLSDTLCASLQQIWLHWHATSDIAGTPALMPSPSENEAIVSIRIEAGETQKTPAVEATETIKEINVAQQALFERLLSTMHHTLATLKQSAQPESGTIPLTQLCDWNVTRHDLLLLATIQSDTTPHYERVISWLTMISKSRFASHFCQQQARLLKSILSDLSDSSDRSSQSSTDDDTVQNCIDRYCDHMSRLSQSPSFFSNHAVVTFSRVDSSRLPVVVRQH